MTFIVLLQVTSSEILTKELQFHVYVYRNVCGTVILLKAEIKYSIIL